MFDDEYCTLYNRKTTTAENTKHILWLPKHDPRTRLNNLRSIIITSGREWILAAIKEQQAKNEIFGTSEAHETERIFPNQSIKAVRDGSCYSPQIQHLRCIVLRVVISLLEPEKKKQCRLYSGQSLWPVIKFSREIPAYDSGAIWYYCLNLFLVLSETLFSTGTLLTFVWHPYV